MVGWLSSSARIQHVQEALTLDLPYACSFDFGRWFFVISSGTVIKGSCMWCQPEGRVSRLVSCSTSFRLRLWRTFLGAGTCSSRFKTPMRSTRVSRLDLSFRGYKVGLCSQVLGLISMLPTVEGSCIIVVEYCKYTIVINWGWKWGGFGRSCKGSSTRSAVRSDAFASGGRVL